MPERDAVAEYQVLAETDETGVTSARLMLGGEPVPESKLAELDLGFQVGTGNGRTYVALVRLSTGKRCSNWVQA